MWGTGINILLQLTVDFHLFHELDDTKVLISYKEFRCHLDTAESAVDLMLHVKPAFITSITNLPSPYACLLVHQMWNLFDLVSSKKSLHTCLGRLSFLHCYFVQCTW